MRMLGQSSIVNMGFFFIILTSAQFEGNLIFLYIYLIYSMLIIQMFSILIILKGKIKNIVQLAGLLNYSFSFFFIASLCILSFAAIPPLNGFLIKFYIFGTMINLGFSSTVFFLLIHSIISAVFYIRLLYYI
jgi:NADH-quinone oxidoreductase subunit N